jgi:outer membrane protein assembly factor BamE (lipoprotein component of BamABCDE complex)
VTDNYSHVEVGSSKEEVLKAFGPPDFEEEGYPKEPYRPCAGYVFMYYFEKPEETNNEIKDKKIEVFFAQDGKVNWIVGNIGLVEKGGYAHRS